MIQSPAGYQGDVRVKRYLDFYQAGYGVAMLSSGVAFSPLSLFAQGEQGGWYDPSDLTTLFQDAAGTTPVTAVEQPVGLVLDKSKGLVLGPELVTNGTFDSGITGWTKGAGSTNPLSWDSSGKRLVVTNDLAYFAYATQTISGLTIGRTYKVSGDLSNATVTSIIRISGIAGFFFPGSSGTGSFFFTATATSHVLELANQQNTLNGVTYWDNISVRELPGNHLSQSTSTARPVLSARVNLLLNTATLATQSVTTVATTYTLAFSGAGSITLSGTATGTYSAGSNSITCTAGTLTLTVSGTVTNADLRPTNAGVGLPSYQRVTTSTDYDTTGFPLYLKFDGTDDSLSSASIDFTSTDKMSVFAGVRKLTNTGALVSIGSSPNSVDGFEILSGGWQSYPSDRWGIGVNGSNTVGVLQAETSAANYGSPSTSLLSLLTDMTLLNPNTFRVNATAVSLTQSTGTPPYGNFGNLPLFVCSREGTALHFNGHLYSLIIRGAATDAATIASTETWVNQKTLAY